MPLLVIAMVVGLGASVAVPPARAATAGLPPRAPLATQHITGASLTWALNDTASAGAYFGGCNFLSAGRAGDNRSAKPWTQTSPSPGYAAQVGNVTIQKPNSRGEYTRPNWATKCTGPDGSTALTTTTSSKSRVEFTGGSGTADPTTGTLTLRWTGSFTSVLDGGPVYWSASDPILTVDADGSGTLTAVLSGYGANMDDGSGWRTLAPVTTNLATFSRVDDTGNGFTVTPDYRGVAVTPAADPAQVRSGGDWGSFPQSFIDFQHQTGESSYWYSSGLNDTGKVAAPLVIAYTPIPAGPSTTDPPAAGPSTTGSPTPTGSAANHPTLAPDQSSVTAASPAPCDPAEGIKGGSLVWGFKASFRSYVASGFPSNSITVTNGAQILDQDLAISGVPASGTYLWPFVSSTGYTSPSDFSVQYGGTVRFTYPSHFFDVGIANPKVVVKGSTGILYADVSLTVTEPGTAPETSTRTAEELATIDLADTGPVSGGKGITRVLHTAIADVDSFSFNGTAFYTKGQALDDATVLLSGCTGTDAPDLNSDGNPPTSGSNNDSNLIPTTRFRPDAGSLPRTGESLPALVLLATLLLAGGAALVMVTRTRIGLPRPLRPIHGSATTQGRRQ